MSSTIERSLVLLKPDAVQRAVCGEILSRFERMGLKMVGMKMLQVTKEFGMQHYADLGARRGEQIQKMMVDFLASGPVVAIVLEGINAVENIRKVVGATEPKASAPGTIRGDYAHVSYAHADATGTAVKNLIHASGNLEDAVREVPLWFKDSELVDWKRADELQIFA